MELYDYQAKFKELIAKERIAEISFQTEEIKRLSAQRREQKGRTLTDMVCQSNRSLESESNFRFVKENDSVLPNNELSIGSHVLLSVSDPFDDSLSGMVVAKSNMFIDVHIERQSNLLQKKLRIDLFVNESTYDAQNRAIDSMTGWNFEGSYLRDVLLHNRKPRISTSVNVLFCDPTLNKSQQLAVEYSLREKDMYLVQGPPGTGKTKTSIEIIRQHLAQGAKILVCADSNIAVDNIMMGLLKTTAVIRVGNSPKILPMIQKYTISNLIQEDPKHTHISLATDRLLELRTRQRKELIPNKKNARGVSYFQIRKLVERGQSEFGIKLSDLESMSRWIILQDEIKHKQVEIERAKAELIRSKIENASVICTTNTQANSDMLKDIVFDMVLIDEAGQSTEPSCLIPISKAKKVILVGDHRQLPPTILSRDAKELSVSLFERMFPRCRYVLLDTQYRMHPNINEFPSTHFYESLLKSAPENESKRLKRSPFDSNVIFINCNGREQKHKGQTSFYNPDEILLAQNIVKEYLALGIDARDIGIISPYAEQVRRIGSQVKNVEANSIDGFQGREKRVIIISLVRSNDSNNLGFLTDLRRLNVALTRAQCELVVIGNEKTISSEKTYSEFIEFVKDKGTYIDCI